MLNERFRPLSYVWMFTGLFIVTLVPFGMCSSMPISTYPNHVARMNIIARLAQSADLAKPYPVNREFIPNLAMGIVVPMMIPVVHDYPARLRPVFEKDIATLFKITLGKGS